MQILTVSSSLPDVRLHGLVAVLGTEVALSGEEELDVLLGGLEGGGELVGRHCDCFNGGGGVSKIERACWGLRT